MGHVRNSVRNTVASCPLLLAAAAHAAALPVPTLTLDETATASPPAETQPATQYPTGDWLGLRPALAQKGLAASGFVQLDVSQILRAGVHTNRTPVRYLLDLNLTLDTDAAFHLPGGTLFFDFQSHDGPDASEDVGDVQGFDNMDAPHFVQIAQLWYQQLLFNNQIRIKAGKIDANNDFSVIDHAKEFLHSAADYTATLFPFVSYPDPAPGASLFYLPNDHFYAGIGAYYSNRHQTVLDIVGHPQSVEFTDGGTFLIAEVGSRWNLSLNKTELPGHAGIGGWYHTGEFPRLSDPHDYAHGAGGPYLFADQTLFSRKATDHTPDQDLGIFLNAGWADPRTSPIDSQIGGGLVATGFIPARPADIVGAFASWAHLPAQPDITHRQELALEAFYKIVLTPWASLKPDFQYIVTPAGRYPDAIVVTLRAEINF